MKEICEVIKANVPEVLDGWERLAQEAPWMKLPREHRIDHLPELIVGLAEASLGHPQDMDAHRQKAAAAVEHGVQRRSQGLDEHLILSEYYLLREALWNHLRRTFGQSDVTTEAIMRLDSAIALATRASLQGFHREALEAAGLWEGLIDRLAAESPLLVKPDQRLDPST